MTRPETVLTVDRVAIDHDIGSKRAALQRVSALLVAGLPQLSATTVLDKLIERERLVSTGIGRGAALPHARMEESGQIAGALLSLPVGVDFDATDGLPVHLVFGLLVPEDAAAEHLQIMASVASAFRNPSLSARLRGAESPASLYRIFVSATAAQSP